MSTMVYQWRANTPWGGDPEPVARELERIRSERGALQTVFVLEEAASAESPLHRFFPWDDAAAAREHRLMLARRLVRSIEIVRDDRPPVSMFVHVARDTENDGSYEPLAIIVSTPDRYLSALAEAQSDLAAAQRRVEELLNVARSTGHKKGEIARIMLAVQALQTANEAIHALN